LKEPTGKYHSVWNGIDPTKKTPGEFEIKFERTEYEVNGVRLHLDASRSKGWEEIDAVQLVGTAFPPVGEEGKPPELPVCQWAAKAEASSEFRSPDWGANQATGLPNTVDDGDFGSAWASKSADGGEEWIKLTYTTPINATGLRIRETFNPGAAVKVALFEADGKEHIVWQGKDTNKTSPGYFELVFPRTDYPVVGVKVYLDTAAVAGWNEIDAVELTGFEVASP
jgi:hypothetical protein